jgi:GST-like protein
MIDLYTWTTPNGWKASIALEEMGLDYTVHPVNLGEGAQHEADFTAISPNGRIPAIVDRDAEGGPLTLMESGAILVYLAEKSGKFLPPSGAARAKTLEWLMWQMGGVGPMAGQAYFFKTSAPDPIPYAIERYTNETLRLLSVLDKQLGRSGYGSGGDYSIADMALYPWVAAMMPVFEEWGVAVPPLPNLRTWLETVGARPAVQKGMALPAV